VLHKIWHVLCSEEQPESITILKTGEFIGCVLEISYYYQCRNQWHSTERKPRTYCHNARIEDFKASMAELTASSNKAVLCTKL
jgi:hypothetical protein